MIKKTLLSASLSLFMLSTSVSLEAEAKIANGSDTIKTLSAVLKKRFRSEPSSIEQSVIPNLYQVMYGSEVIYVSADGKYFLAGDLINLDTRENISDIAKQSVRLDILNAQDNKPVVFKAKDEKHVLTVFTDIDCPYCSKLHREVPALNAKGITIEYLMFPRAGLKSQSYKKAVSMWCADDNEQAMTDAKERKPIQAKTCVNPIADQYNLAGAIGVTGTPALITKSGKLIPGYMPADRLVDMLEEDAKKSK